MGHAPAQEAERDTPENQEEGVAGEREAGGKTVTAVG